MSDASAPRTYGGILAGGFSRRMGRPKHLIEYDGRSLLATALTALAGHCERVFLLGNVQTWPDDTPRLAEIPDLPDVRGPIAGIGAALRQEPKIRWVILACDMPLVTANEVRWLLDQHAASPQASAVMPWVDDRPLPTFALYTPKVMTAVEALVAAGRGPIGLGHREDVLTVAPPSAAPFVNVNTPAELLDLRRPDPR